MIPGLFRPHTVFRAFPAYTAQLPTLCQLRVNNQYRVPNEGFKDQQQYTDSTHPMKIMPSMYWLNWTLLGISDRKITGIPRSISRFCATQYSLYIRRTCTCYWIKNHIMATFHEYYILKIEDQTAGQVFIFLGHALREREKAERAKNLTNPVRPTSWLEHRLQQVEIEK